MAHSKNRKPSEQKQSRLDNSSLTRNQVAVIYYRQSSLQQADTVSHGFTSVDWDQFLSEGSFKKIDLSQKQSKF